MMAVIEARGVNTDEQVEHVTTMIQAVAEAYPELQSSDNYRELMNELATTENLIANVRSNYNKWVTNYNSYIKKFPNRQILNMLGYESGGYEKLNFNVSEDAPTKWYAYQYRKRFRTR